MLVSPLRIFATLAVATAVGVSAQDACMLSCFAGAVSPSTCTSFTDLTCVCTNTAFQAAAAACLKANCTAADQQAALQLQQAECTNSTSTNSTSSSPSSSSSTAPSSTSSTATKNGAVQNQLPFLNGAIALATVALGGALFL
ncbi:hypothetical protein V8E53_014308 [Lactarius tabidus]